MPEILVGDPNQKISKAQLDQIRSLRDFDLTMLISDVHDHGWPIAARTLELIMECYEKEAKQNGRDHRA